ncbi:Glutathione S-transferase, protein [Akanthomyces lecanii RCEF 1005]|uniref:Glutathione S-transferase, protein n=1 Tax=Akanthomyces lecanii RCEF 1005 TaxID=1081108 RepID=A0A168DVD2_CORDF|nr:Glutathione S-transferase, protein [Akanthomyces lecanii RCEF 1005]
MASNNSTSDEVQIFIIPSKDGATWSHHEFRILYSLQHKQIPYSVKHVEYPDIESTFAPTTLAPKSDPLEPYEIPVLVVQPRSGDARYYMGALNIIQALEEIQPEHPLLYDTPRSVEFRSRFGPALAPVLQAVAGNVAGILSERSAAAFAEKRRKRWGKTVEQWAAEHPMSEALVAAKPRLEEFGDWLELVPGPFVHGDQPSYADFTVVSVLEFARAVGFAEAVEAVVGMHPSLKIIYQAVMAKQPVDGQN